MQDDSKAHDTPIQREDLAIVTATYNEAGNIAGLLSALRRVAPSARILVVDDDSADGTAGIVQDLQTVDPKLHLLSRPGKLGIGSAHKDGIRWAYDQGVQTLVTMDADFTHTPEDIPLMLNAAREADIAIGTRFERSESLAEWSLLRRVTTRVAHLLTRLFLKIPFDCSGAFRVYDLDAIPRELWSDVEADDYGFFFESLHRLHMAGHSINQIPIVLPARASGNSKMSLKDAYNGLSHLLRYARRVRRA